MTTKTKKKTTKKRGRTPNHDCDIDKLQHTIPAEPEQLAKVILTSPPKPR